MHKSGYKFILVLAALVFGALEYRILEAADFMQDSDALHIPALRIIDSIPQSDAGIIHTTPVHEDTSFAVLVQTRYGIDQDNPDSVRFFINDGEYEPYQRNLRSAAVRVIDIETANSHTGFIWLVYDRSLDLDFPPVYALDTVVAIGVTVKDIYNHKISGVPIEFRIESDSEQAHMFDNLPESVSFDVFDSEIIQNSGIEIISGVLTGAKIFFSGDEPLVPAFGPTDAVESTNTFHGNSLGLPLNLTPHTVFNHPVKLFIPYPPAMSVNQLYIYYHNGVKWLPACDAEGNLLPGGEGWMVPGSRVNHTDQIPPLIEIEVYHFSAAQAVSSETSVTTDNTHRKNSGSGAVVFVHCFIGATASDGKSTAAALILLVLLAAFICSLRQVISRANK